MIATWQELLLLRGRRLAEFGTQSDRPGVRAGILQALATGLKHQEERNGKPRARCHGHPDHECILLLSSARLVMASRAFRARLSGCDAPQGAGVARYSLDFAAMRFSARKRASRWSRATNLLARRSVYSVKRSINRRGLIAGRLVERVGRRLMLE